MVRGSGKKSTAEGPLDPLYVVFEQHLCNFQDDEVDRKSFVEAVVRDYLTYLRKLNIAVPKSLEGLVVEELATQVSTMLVKKIYGCLSIQDYRQGLPTPTKRRAKTRYSKLTRARKSAA